MSKNKQIAIATLVSHEVIERNIYLIRGKKVMFDHDLASLYGVETKALNRAVKRNLSRFPEDFMFQLTPDEALRCHFGTSKKTGKGGRRYLPYAFTEHGILILSSVLNSLSESVTGQCAYYSRFCKTTGVPQFAQGLENENR